MKEGISETVPTPQPKRKAGRKMSDEERRAKPMHKLLSQISQFIRRDFGGQDHLATTVKKARAWAETKNLNISDGGFEVIGEFAMAFALKQLEGCQERASDTIAELRRRETVIVAALKALTDGKTIEAVRLLTSVVNGTTTNPTEYIL